MPHDTVTGLDAQSLNEMILRSVVDHAIVTLDANGIVTSWNEGAERILGWTEDEIVGQSADVFFTPEDVERNRPEAEMRMALDDGRADDVRWHMRKDGRRFWGSGLMMPLLAATNHQGDDTTAQKRMSGFVKIFRDRTRQHEADIRITRLETRATLAMRRSGTVGVFDVDLSEDIAVADAICAGMHGVDPQVAEKGVLSEAFFAGIHPDDVARIRGAKEAAIRDVTDFDEIYMMAQAETGPRWLHSQASVQLDRDNRPARFSGIVVDITEQKEQSHMQETRLRFYDAVRDLQDVGEIADLASCTIAETLHASRAGHGLIESDGDTIDVRADWNVKGNPSIKGRLKFSDYGSFISVLHAGETVVMEDATTDPRVSDSPALAGLNIRSLVNMPLMQRGKLKAVLFVNDERPRRWSDAELHFMSAIFDRTYAAIDRLRAEREKEMMAAELAHRMKNMLTIAQVVVSQSLRGAEDIEQARASITARLNALSKAQDVLTRVDHSDAPLRDVINAALRPFETDKNRISLSGPNINVTSQQVLGLSLGLHELATNAAKHGAMSMETGRIHIEWSNHDGTFHFEWRESGGPAVTVPDTTGFGSTILERAVGGYFQGKSEIEYKSEGVLFRLEGQL